MKLQCLNTPVTFPLHTNSLAKAKKSDFSFNHSVGSQRCKSIGYVHHVTPRAPEGGSVPSG